MRLLPLLSANPARHIMPLLAHVFALHILSAFILVHCQTALALTIQNSCLNCHLGLRPELAQYAHQWAMSAHALVPVCCEECHGGNPNSPKTPRIGEEGFTGIPSKQAIPALCNRCHADVLYMRKYDIRVDEENQYENSVHGQQLLKKNNPDVACCVDCHGSHDIRKPDDPRSRVNHSRIAYTCARCHSDINRMKPYGLPTDQIVKYKKSYHGKVLYQKVDSKNTRLVPSCPGCHGIHSGKPAGVTQVADACYNCHLNVKRYFQKSIHSLLLKKNQKPRCIDCHGYHDIPRPSEDLFTGETGFHCGSCHTPESPEYQNGIQIRALIEQAKRVTETGQSSINQVKRHLDIDISSLNMKMDDALESLNQAIKATHSQDVQTVSLIVQDVYKSISTLDQQVSKHYQEARKRKQWLARVLLLISAAFSLIAYQRHRLKTGI
ncbi:MAG: hypothetical protein AB1847_07905 [bacterium]